MSVTTRTIANIQTVIFQNCINLVALDSEGEVWIKAINPPPGTNLSTKWQRVEPIEVDDADPPSGIGATYPVPSNGSGTIPNTTNLTYSGS